MSKLAPAYPKSGKALLAGKTVVVTAAAGTGIGWWTARRAIDEGALVLISDFHERRLGEAAEKLEKLTGNRQENSICDVTNEDHEQNLVKTSIAELGQVYVL